MKTIDHKFLEEVKKFVEREAVESAEEETVEEVAPSAETIFQDGEEIQLNRYLTDEEADELEEFLKENSNDTLFGNAVQTMVYDRFKNASDMYQSVYLSKQKYYKAIDTREQNVSKRTVWQIIVGLKCNLDEADRLLYYAGYVRRKNKLDLTMEFFITHRNYDIDEINYVLETLEETPFSCCVEVKDKI